MRDLRKKLMASIAMVVVAGVMLTGTSYAWFTLSTNPEVKNITMNLSSNENLEIALDDAYSNEAAVNSASNIQSGVQGSNTGDPYTWGNTIDLSTALVVEGKSIVDLQPVRFDAATSGSSAHSIMAPTYGADGRVSGIVATTPAWKSDYTSKGSNGGVKTFSNTTTSNIAFSFTYWMRSNKDVTVNLTSSEKLLANDTTHPNTQNKDPENTVTGAGSYLKVPISGENSAGRIENYLKNLVIRFVAEDAYTGNAAQTKGATIGYARLVMTAKSGTNIGYEDKVEGAEGAQVTYRYYPLQFMDKPNNDSATAAAETINLTANNAMKITTYVYIDGATITNADALLDDITDMQINMQFTNSATELTGAMSGSGAIAP